MDLPVVVTPPGGEAPPWARAVAGVRPLALDPAAPAESLPGLTEASCAVIDGRGAGAVDRARQVHALDPAVQIILVAPGERHQALRRAVLLTPGLGEIWIVDPGEVLPDLLARAGAVTRQRRAYRLTRSRVEHDLAAIHPYATRRAPISDALLAAILAILPDPVFSVDEKSTVLTWNAAAERVLGLRRSDVVGRPLQEALATNVADLLPKALESAKRGGRVEVRFRGRGGAESVGEMAAAEVEAEGRRVYSLILRDVTEERKLQEERESQAAELEMQAEELQSQAAQLEEVQAELEEANDGLELANRRLVARAAEAARERADAELARARLDAVLRQMPSGVLIAEAGTDRIVFSNEQVDGIWRRPLVVPATPAHGLEREGYRPDGTRYAPQDWPLSRALRGESVLDEEIVILRGDGTRGMISVSSRPVHDRDGSIVAAVAIFDDVTDQKEREAESAYLHEAGRILASSLDYVSTIRTVARLAVPQLADWCAVDILREDGVERLAVVHSDPAKEELAKEIGHLWPARPDANIGVRNVLRTGEPELHREVPEPLLRRLAVDEEHFASLLEIGFRSAMIVPMVSRGSTLGAITLVAAESGRQYDEHDLSVAEQLASRAAVAVENARLLHASQQAREEAERARAEAEAASRAKSEFLATMSHEIRTPINAIIGYTELLEMGLQGPITEGQRSHLQRVRASSGHLLVLIEDILDLAKVEAGRMDLAHEHALAIDAIADALALVGPQAAEKRIAVEAPLAEDAGTAYVGDEDRVRQILVNLLSNAVKFTPEGGRICISCGTADTLEPGVRIHDEGPWTYFRVEDNGVGIAAADLEKVFRPFEQVEGGHTRTHGGTGLGLSISRQLARLMGGDLVATSEPGVGSVFTLWLPSRSPLALEETIPGRSRGELVPQGLDGIGEAIRDHVDGIVAEFVRRLADDPAIPLAGSSPEQELEDHAATLLANVAQGLIVLQNHSHDATALLSDGSEIQRTIADLHGVQRARLGWTEEALSREYEILLQCVEAAIRRSAPVGVDPANGVRVVGRFIRTAERVSIQSLRRASVARQT